MAPDDTDREDIGDGNGAELTTSLPGIEVSTSLGDAPVEDLEAVHRRQLEYALEHAEEAKKATRM